ncbi:HTH-type transcriptional regulator RutR [Saccharospirillum mangrovi]|uniref:HTH-type transcriptional regulator RutR n=1 Tax=Saccharospirillum mangrovi TaxID=2161747 RepID=UPI0013B391E6|nr:HTH-type transcriptional regulator RutR [Saccharospirillum mangrovi]
MNDKTRLASAEVANRSKRTPTPASLKRRQRNQEKKRAAILEASLRTFSQFGLHGASLDQIAAEADVSKTNLLYYFPTKEALYVQVMRELLSLWLMPLSGFNEDQNPLEALREYIRIKLEFSRDNPAESRLFCMEILQGAPLLLAELQQPLHDRVQAKVAVIQSWIDSGKLKPIDPYHLIFSIWATTQHYADFRVQIEAVAGRTLDDPDFFADTLRNLQALLVDSLKP